MKNLFIMHTQYNLIISAAVVSRFPNAENTLILYSEFSLNDEMRKSLECVFDRVFVVREQFGEMRSEWAAAKEIRTCLKKVKTLKKEIFDCVYMSQDRPFDRILWEQVKRNNPQAQCYNIEEDAYYSINEQFNQNDFQYTIGKKAKMIRTWRALLLWGHPYDYRECHYCYGMSRIYNGAVLLFPQLARREMRNKKLEEVKQQELVAGIDALYSQKKTEYPSAEKYTVFFFDLMNRYKNPEFVKEIVREILAASQKNGRKVLFKYHPRETEKFADLASAHEIPHLIPAEKVLLDLKDKDVVVMGNATTSCIVAAKLGFKVISICKIEAPNNQKMHSAMEAMNILCIEEVQDIKKLFNKENVK